MTADLGRLLSEVGAVLLDFDGPVCSIFAGYPAPQIAAELVDLLRRRGVNVPADLASESDPLEVLRRTGAAGNHGHTRAVEDALSAAERQAAAKAEPTPFGREVIVAARQAGLPVAVVSNNSAEAVTAYLVAHRVAGYVCPVIGRAYAEPARMKPNPEPILKAVRALGQSPERCVLIGDSESDIEGAQAAGIRVIGYANRGYKIGLFRTAGADAVITSMSTLAEALMKKSGDPT
ncbi:HAD family hydrolase [Micromonospora sp. C28ISP2-4]|uniref:HAD family hydrolase n=1 Tax=Micromonospora sp. C28ISP2-4 TaxID=3059523 RepID=UPI0026743E62|nr:HAD-IA family hydrolase [Micromonospora sp. C28ISP2-4]MDO3687365.1 HAD-IA family hydrolase [Micromonospora sp. C28ISP2-4]